MPRWQSTRILPGSRKPAAIPPRSPDDRPVRAGFPGLVRQRRSECPHPGAGWPGRDLRALQSRAGARLPDDRRRLAQDYPRAAKLQNESMDLIDALFSEVNPILSRPPCACGLPCRPLPPAAGRNVRPRAGKPAPGHAPPRPVLIAPNRKKLQNQFYHTRTRQANSPAAFCFLIYQ